MRSLFWKIFLVFWLAMVLIGAALVILALNTDPHRAQFGRHRQALQQQGQELVAAYEKGGARQLKKKIRDPKGASRSRLFLFKGTESLLPGEPVPPRPRRLVPLALHSGEVQIKPGPHGLWVALPLERDYTLLVKARPSGRLEMLLDPHRLGSRLLITFVIAGIICYLLARSLTAPIAKLRRATRRFAAGDLATRVQGTIKGKDEIGALAGDFDLMAERIEDLVGSQQRLLRDISHELRSPLARLAVSLELARQRSGAEAQSDLARIEREAERLNEMIGQLLSLNLLEGKAEPAKKTEVDLGPLVRSIVEDADFEARNRNRSVVLRQADPVVLQGSPELLHRAIENVVRNAVHYTAEATAVEVYVHHRENEPIAIRIRDHGPGVPEASLEKIFHPFYRVAEARDRQSGGTGIGLAIAERAVRLHGGTIRARNPEDGGLELEILLPT
ncbi:ATP-binding protein [uncultured Desulfuromonas sp.]|uniref:ATP-binding protein n=1 Tax=uncultured Desulfuromonas sp. TaxID=181013 RepID=UPI0026068FAE|nr:ATP-binding protein [uncultured Desulfuromonas sp.]